MTHPAYYTYKYHSLELTWGLCSILTTFTSTLNFLIHSISPKTLSCPAERITPALLDNVCPTVKQSFCVLMQFQHLLIGQGTREIVLPFYRKKNQKQTLISLKVFQFKQEWMTPETQRLSLTNRGLDVDFRK